LFTIGLFAGVLPVLCSGCRPLLLQISYSKGLHAPKIVGVGINPPFGWYTAYHLFLFCFHSFQSIFRLLVGILPVIFLWV